MTNLNKMWVISDTHFNHEFMIKGGIRPDNYQQNIIDNWKLFVGKDDIVIHLGDVIFSRPSELGSILNDLPGYKILVMGNHDKNKPNWYLSQGFQEVHEEYFVTLPNRKKVHCTHIPIKTKSDYNLSGHLHNYKGNNTFRHKECLHLDLKSRIYSCELEGYRPVLLSYLVTDTHESHIYIREKGSLSIRAGFIWNRTKTFLYKLGQTKIF